jgi:large subunit ribosomal protein L20
MRVKGGATAHAKHQKIRRATKGMTLAHRSSVRRGKQAIVKSLTNSYNDRRTRKRTFRQLWNARINAAARLHGSSYSQLMNSLKKEGIMVNRKILSDIAVHDPAAFEVIVKAVK